MTVSSIVPVNSYVGNSSTTEFDFDFLIENESELVVEHISENGVYTKLVYGVDYSINQIGSKNGSSIVFPLEGSSFSVLNPQESITLYLTLSIEQENEFKNSSYFNFEVLEWTFDYIVRILQILNRKIDRCVKVGEGINTSPDSLLESINDSVNTSIQMANSASQSKEICEGYKTTINDQVTCFETQYETCMQNILDVGIETRADVNFSNLSEVGENYFVKSSALETKTNTNFDNVTKVGKETIIGWGMPDYSAAIELPISLTSTDFKSYDFPIMLLIRGSNGSGGTNGYGVRLEINGATPSSINLTGYNYNANTCTFYLDKNTQFKVYYNSGVPTDTTYCYVYPLKSNN